VNATIEREPAAIGLHGCARTETADTPLKLGAVGSPGRRPCKQTTRNARQQQDDQ
jgi:hypothetical protein